MNIIFFSSHSHDSLKKGPSLSRTTDLPKPHGVDKLTHASSRLDYWLSILVGQLNFFSPETSSF